jgi:hypothetical protein
MKRLCLSLALMIPLCSCQQLAVQPQAPTATLDDRRVAALNLLRNDITAQYGFRDGAPRVNLGPCGRFARDFRERWNARFRDPVTIAFVMSGDGRLCHHVLVSLPGGRYFDGGNGVVTESFLATLYPGSRIEAMTTFDFKLLDQRSYGLDRNYPECENYSDEFTRKVIDQRLEELTTRGGQPRSMRAP